MRLIVRFVCVVILTLGFCGIVSASGDQPVQASIITPDPASQMEQNVYPVNFNPLFHPLISHPGMEPEIVASLFGCCIPPQCPPCALPPSAK